MILGVPRERVATEHRVALTPAGARSLVHQGHVVVIESGAGRAARFADEKYADAGARVVYGTDEVFGRADLVIKVSALAAEEVPHLREGQAILAFHHLAAASRSHLEALLRRGVTLIGLEILEDSHGDAPVLHAMSEIGGQLAVGVAAHQLQTLSGGRGILLGGSIGIPPAHVVILGAGVSGVAAARRAVGNGAQVTLLDTSLTALRRADEIFGRGIVTEVSHLASVDRAVAYADVVIGAVLVRGERAPLIVTREVVRRMKPGAVIIDLAIDQGGCVETSRPTTLADPVFVEHEVVHCAVPNLSSAVARTASLALTYAALPFVETLAARGLDSTLMREPGFARGLYLYQGELVCPSVGRAFGLRATAIGEIVGAPQPMAPSAAAGRRP
ncbi:MAG TPA: alanine dehydrogenase [Candidatus Polarisedimenticolia bacterium]|nr:alanine dehydrogenase [Candidatus Polarisedimenticolia bacterium]